MNPYSYKRFCACFQIVLKKIFEVKTVFSINGAEKTEFPNAGILKTPLFKNQLKLNQEYHIRNETIRKQTRETLSFWIKFQKQRQ